MWPRLWRMKPSDQLEKSRLPCAVISDEGYTSRLTGEGELIREGANSTCDVDIPNWLAW